MLRIERRGSAAIWTIDRPHAKNALDRATMTALSEAAEAARGDAAVDGDDEVVIVVGDGGSKEVDGAEGFAAEFATEEKLVLGRAVAEFVLVEERAGALLDGVEESGIVGREDDGAIEAGGEFVFEGLAGFDVIDVEGGFVGSALTKAVDEKAAIA